MSAIRVSGHVKFLLQKGSGSVYSWEGQNLVVREGLALLATRMIGNSISPPAWMACGTSDFATTVDMVALQGTESQRKAVTATVSGASVTYKAVFGPGLSVAATIHEYGLFNASTAGTMFCRFLSSPVELEPEDELSVEWTITFEED